MTLDTQNLGIPCILMRIHSQIYRKEHEWDTSPLLENLALFKEVSLWETCSVRVLVGNGEGWRDEGGHFSESPQETWGSGYFWKDTQPMVS